jgi:hypothetical protein
MLLVRLLADLAPDEAVKLIESWTSSPTDFEMLYYVPILLRHKPAAEVLTFMEAHDTGGPYTECWRARVISLIPQRRNEARQLCNQLARKHRSFDVRNACLTTLLLLGDVDHVRRLSAELVESSTAPFWYSREVMQYLADPDDPESLLQAARRSRVSEHEALYAIAINQLAEGNRSQALVTFRQCVAANSILMENHWWARTFLHFMETYPDWPTNPDAVSTERTTRVVPESGE